MIQPITQGDIFSNANTIILMGRTRQRRPARPGARRFPSTAAAPAAMRSFPIESPIRDWFLDTQGPAVSGIVVIESCFFEVL